MLVAEGPKIGRGRSTKSKCTAEKSDSRRKRTWDVYGGGLNLWA